jgi:hypothetical protein
MPSFLGRTEQASGLAKSYGSTEVAGMTNAAKIAAAKKKKDEEDAKKAADAKTKADKEKASNVNPEQVKTILTGLSPFMAAAQKSREEEAKRRKAAGLKP